MTNLRHLLPPCTFYAPFIFLLLIAIPGSLLANGDDVTSGELHLFGASGAVDPALLKDTGIDVRVSGMIARVTIRQTFQNLHSEWVEGEYVFPLSPDSAVDYMAMKIGERVIIGEVREKQEAKRRYEQAKAEGRKASLVTQQRTNLFTNRVANIAPGEFIMVELRYVETLRYDQGRFSLRLPTTITSRYIPGNAFANYRHTDFQTPATQSSGWAVPTDEVPDAHLISPPMVPTSLAAPLTLTATIDAGVSLTEVESLYHEATVAASNGVYELTLEPGAALTRDVELQWTPRTGRAPVAALFQEQVEGQDYLLLMLMPPQQLGEYQPLPREAVYIIDTSGSMSGVAIAQAREALLDGLGRLSPGDRFNVIEFNNTFSALWPAAVPASTANIDQASRFVQALDAGGGTNMAPALQFALSTAAPEGFVRQVVFITDGSVGNEAALLDLIESRRGDSRVFTVGIGSAPNSLFMEKAAQAGRGSFTYISAQAEVNRRMSDLFHKLENPVVTDIQWDFDGRPVEVLPRRAPDLYAGEPLILTARLDGVSPDTLTIRGMANGSAFSQQMDLQQGRPAASISKLWARRKLASLYEHERAVAPGSPELAATVKQDIIQLALEHQLMSRYTSFIAIEDRISRPPEWMLTRQVAPSAMPAGNTMRWPGLQRPTNANPLPPGLVANASVSVPMPQGALGVGLAWWLALLSVVGLLMINARYLRLRYRLLAQR